MLVSWTVGNRTKRGTEMVFVTTWSFGPNIHTYIHKHTHTHTRLVAWTMLVVLKTNARREESAGP